MKTAEQSEDISALELDKAHYKLGEGITFGEQLLHIRGFGNIVLVHRELEFSDLK